MQLIRQENMRHVTMDDHESKLQDRLKNTVICLNEIKMGVLAKGLCYPGSITLLANLLSSVSEDETQHSAEWQQ